MTNRIVILPDGDVGTVTGPVGAHHVLVTHQDRAIGRGPWEYQADQLALADDAAADAYVKRCDRYDQSVSSLPGSAYAA